MNYLLRFRLLHHHGAIHFDLPWWILSNPDLPDLDIEAAIQAPTEAAARERIYAAYARRSELDIACEAMPDGWMPFCAERPRAGWMRWAQ